MTRLATLSSMGCPRKDDVFLEQTRVDIGGALAPRGLLDDHRHHVGLRHVVGAGHVIRKRARPSILVFHARSAAALTCTRSGLLRNLADHRLGGQHQGADGSGVLKSRTSHLGRVDHAGFHQVLILAGGGIEAVVLVFVGQNLLDEDRALIPGVARDLADRLFAGALDDLHARQFVAFPLRGA